MSCHPSTLTRRLRTVLAPRVTPRTNASKLRSLRPADVGEYPEVFISTDPELPAEESALAMDLLDMFRVIAFSIRQLRGAQIEVDPELERRLAFAGLDLQRTREARLLQYIRHLVSEDRWPELLPALDADNDYGNSHSMKLPSYQRLLTEYEAIRAERRPQLGLDGYLLSLGELQRLDAAQG
ncbi:YfbU family protein [Dermacoccus nishinomiyaensis]